MSKNYFIIFLFLFLTNCSTPGTALLGPVLTGATTKSVAQASLSFGTNQIVNKLHKASKKNKKGVKKISNRNDDIRSSLHL